MTTIQAIDLLKGLEQSLDDYCELNDEGKTAFRMAITALELFGNSEQLPSVQPEKRTEERTKTHSCDLIDRQAAIALAKDIIVPIKDGTVYKYRCIDPDSIKELPSECNVIYCRDCRFYIGHRCQATRGLDDWRNQDDYCSRAERIDQ